MTHTTRSYPKTEPAVLVFPGQGSQRPSMAAGLLDASPVFAARLRRCAAAVETHLDRSVEGVLRQRPSAPSLDRVEVVQPVHSKTLWYSATRAGSPQRQIRRRAGDAQPHPGVTTGGPRNRSEGCDQRDCTPTADRRRAETESVNTPMTPTWTPIFQGTQEGL